MFHWSLVIMPVLLTIVLVILASSEWRNTVIAGCVSLIVGLATMNDIVGIIGYLCGYLGLAVILAVRQRRHNKRSVVCERCDSP